MFCYLFWDAHSTETEALRTDGLTQSFTQVMCYDVNYVLKVTHCGSTMTLLRDSVGLLSSGWKQSPETGKA